MAMSFQILAVSETRTRNFVIGALPWVEMQRLVQAEGRTCDAAANNTD